MKRRILLVMAFMLLTVSFLTVVGCSNSKNSEKSTKSEDGQGNKEQIVNVYSDRHYDTDKELFKQFTKETGIKVNVVEGKSDELIERLVREGADSEADLLVTADAGRLHRAKEQGLLQAMTSDVLFSNIPENLRDVDNTWVGLTVRARVLVYAKDRVKPTDLSTYADLTSAKWKDKILTRSSSAVYNQSLLASFIALHGEEKASAWAKGIVANLAKEPQGNDRDQATAVVAGEGDVAIMNTYYIGKMLTSSNPEEVKVAENVGVFFPDQKGEGTHINVSGGGLTKNAKHKENAIKLMEFLAGEKAQKDFAESNFEYPANPKVEQSELLKSWGEFKPQNIKLSLLGENNSKAVQIFDQVGWK